MTTGRINQVTTTGEPHRAVGARHGLALAVGPTQQRTRPSSVLPANNHWPSHRRSFRSTAGTLHLSSANARGRYYAAESASFRHHTAPSGSTDAHDATPLYDAQPLGRLCCQHWVTSSRQADRQVMTRDDRWGNRAAPYASTVCHYRLTEPESDAGAAINAKSSGESSTH